MAKYKIFGTTTQDLKLPKEDPIYNLDFVNNQTIPPDYTFTRNSSGTYVDSDGLIKTAAINQPRFDYDPVTNSLKGLLIEDTKDNINLSQSSSAWAENNSTIIANQAVSPDGTFNAWSATGNSTGVNTGLISRTGRAATAYFYYTASIFWKQGTSSGTQIQCPFSSTISGFSFAFYIDSSGRLIDGGGGAYGDCRLVSYGAIPYANGWYRLYGTFFSVSNDANVRFWVYPNVNNTGSRTIGLTSYYWGTQLEVSDLTSYIPTDVSTGIRQLDALVLNNANVNSQGTFYIENTVKSTQELRTLFSADNGTDAISMQRYFDTLTGTIGSNGEILEIISDGVDANMTKRALYYGPNKSFIASSSSLETPYLNHRSLSVNIPSNINRIIIGNNSTFTSSINGHIRKFLYYPSTVTEDNVKQLANETQIIRDTFNVFSNKTITGPITTDGLVLYLDAGNRNSYPGYGNYWYDLSGGNRHYRIYNPSTVSWNSNGYFDITNSNTGNNALNVFYRHSFIGPKVNTFGFSSTNEHTIMAVGYFVYNSANEVFFHWPTSGTRGIFSHFPLGGVTAYYDVSGCCGPTNRVGPIDISTFGGSTNLSLITFRTRTNQTPNRQIFKNTTSLFDSGVNSTATITWDNTNVATLASQWVGRLYTFFVYNRALSDAEITANYNAISTRFGI